MRAFRQAACLMAAMPGYAEIITTDDIRFIEDKLKNIDKKAWIIWDCENTLLKPKDLILRKENAAALKEMLRRNMSIMGLIDGRRREAWRSKYIACDKLLVHARLPEIVRDLQARGHTTFVLTSIDGEQRNRDELNSAQVRRAELRTFGFDFSKSHGGVPDGRIGRGHKLYSVAGIVCTNSLSKGRALKIIVKLMGAPSSIVFIDDSRKNIEAVHNAAKDLGLPCVAIHWTATLKRSKGAPELSCEVAEKQVEVLVNENVWMSDMMTKDRLERERSGAK